MNRERQAAINVIARLVYRIGEFASEGSSKHEAAKLLDAELARLPAEPQSDAKDAARFRWLRDRYVAIVNSDGKFNLPDYQEVSYIWRRREWVAGKPVVVCDGLDAAIDAAMAKENSNGQ